MCGKKLSLMVFLIDEEEVAAATQSVTSAEVQNSIWDNTTNVKISAHQSGSARD